LHDEIQTLLEEGVTTLVSLVDVPELGYLGLETLPALCQTTGLHHLHYPIPDLSAPAEPAPWIIDTILEKLRDGESVAVHCRGGIGRTGTIAVAVLLRLGFAPRSALAMAAKARGMIVPETPEQIHWLAQYARRYSPS
jgi:protein-tyrosine phosphatase